MSAHSGGLWGYPRHIPSQGPYLRFRTDIEGDSGDTPEVLDYKAIAAILRAAIEGDAAAMLELNEEMEGRDLHLRSVAETRRGSLTIMEYLIEPCEATAEDADQKLAIKAADYIRGELANVEAFEPVLLDGMALAIGPNLAVIQVIWRGIHVVDFEWTDAGRLVIDPQQSADVRIITDDAPDGEIPDFAKFITHIPRGLGSSIFTNTISRGQAVLYVMKNLAMKDWATFAEIFGMPFRVGRYEKTATEADKKKALAALRDMGSQAYGLISKDIEYEMKEINRGTEPYSAMVEFISKQQAIGYLGQNLTTDSTGSGGLGGAGAAQVHEGVRRLITERDAKAEAWTLRSTLFAWMLRFRFPDRWQSMPVPKFRRIWRNATTLDMKAEMIRKASQEIGIPVPMNWAKRELGIPDADEGEGIIQRIEPAAAVPFG